MKKKNHAHKPTTTKRDPAPVTLLAGSSSAKPPEQHKPVLTFPLDRERTLQSLSQIIVALKQTEVALQTQAALLEQQKQMIEANWNREALSQPRQRAPYTSGGFLVV